MKFILKFFIVSIIALFVVAIPVSLWLKTDDAKQQIAGFIENFLVDEFGIEANIEGLDISLPIIFDVKQISLKDTSGELLDIKNLRINIIPSLMSLWEITIWSLSADEIRLFKKPELKISQKKNNGNDTFFNPNIIVKDINFASIVLDKKFTGQDADVIFSIDSYIMYRAKKQSIDCSLISKLISPSIEKFSNNQIEVVGKYDLDKELIDLRSIKFMSKIVNINGNFLADIKKDKLSGVLKYNIADITELMSQKVDGLSGSFVGQVNLDGSVTIPVVKPSGNLDVRLPKNDYFNYYPLSFDGSFRLESGDIDGSINLKQGDIEAKGNIRYKDSKIYLKQVRAEAPDFLKTADLVFDTQSKIIAGDVRFRDKNLRESSKYFPFLKNGAVDLNFKYSSYDNITQQLKIDGKIKRLSTRYGTFGFIDVNLDIVDLWKAKLNDSILKIRSFNYENIVLKETKLKAKSISDIFRLDCTIASGQPYPINLTFNSDIKKDVMGNKIIAKITDLSGFLREVPIKQNTDINIEVGSDQIFSTQNLGIGDGALNLDAKFSDSKIYANIVIDKAPIMAFPDVFPRILRNASASSNVELSGTKSNPRLDVAASLIGIGFDTKHNDLSMNAIGKYQDRQANLDMTFLRQSLKLANSNVVLPMRFSLNPWELIIDDKKSFSANLMINENFDLISFIPMPIGHEASGSLKGNLKADGTILHPKLSGKMDLSDGKYKYKKYGVNLKNIQGIIIADGSNFTLDSFVIEDHFDNKVSSSGKFDLKDENKFVIQVKTEKFHPMSTRYLQGEVLGNIVITGNNQKAMAKGKLDLGPLEIKIPEHFRQNIPTLNISEVIEENDVSITETEANPYNLELDIKLNADKQVYVRGWGVDTQLKGKLHITGQADDPIINGTLKSERGRYQEFGKVLNVREGVLNFDGPISPSPYLNIVGVTNVGGTEIRLVLSGSILNPDISIESTPALSQETALSKLLFGDDPENISTFQALQLADGMRRLSGHGGGFDPLGLGRKILGVDDISFKQDSEDPNKSSVGVGKHLSDKVYFEIESGRSENSTKTKVEVQLTPKISVENVFEPEGNTSVGVNWRFDY